MWRNVHRELPPALFHYTDAAGLSGIVRSGNLWASHVYYVNDAHEFIYARGVINQAFDDRIEQSDASIGEKLKQLRASYRAHVSIWESIADAYLVCFCEVGNLLSQWRAYAANGEGFAVKFDPHKLMESLRSDTDVALQTKLFKVIYSAKEQREFIDLALGQLLLALEHSDAQEILSLVPLVFSEMAFSFKHNAFAEEREWRLVFTPRVSRVVDVRVKNGRLFPYATIPICAPEERPPYCAVMHGPTLESSNTTKALGILLGKAHPRFWVILKSRVLTLHFGHADNLVRCRLLTISRLQSGNPPFNTTWPSRPRRSSGRSEFRNK